MAGNLLPFSGPSRAFSPSHARCFARGAQRFARAQSTVRELSENFLFCGEGPLGLLLFPLSQSSSSRSPPPLAVPTPPHPPWPAPPTSSCYTHAAPPPRPAPPSSSCCTHAAPPSPARRTSAAPLFPSVSAPPRHIRAAENCLRGCGRGDRFWRDSLRNLGSSGLPVVVAP